MELETDPRVLKTPGYEFIKAKMAADGDKLYTCGEALEIVAGAIKADDDSDKIAANLTLHALDYMGVIGLPLASALYIVALTAGGGSMDLEIQDRALGDLAAELASQIVAKSTAGKINERDNNTAVGGEGTPNVTFSGADSCDAGGSCGCRNDCDCERDYCCDNRD